MSKRKGIVLVGILGLLLILTIVPVKGFAQVQDLINYQGYLTDTSGSPIDTASAPGGTIQITFKIYGAETGGTAVWEETQDVVVKEGIINVQLGGSGSPFIPEDLPYWLGIAVGTDEEMTERQPLTAVPFALHAQEAGYAESVGAGAVGQSAIADNAVTDAKILGPISSSKIQSTGLDADTVDGKHAADLLDKTTYDSDGNGKIDSAESADTVAIPLTIRGNLNTGGLLYIENDADNGNSVFGRAYGVFGIGVRGLATNSYGRGVYGRTSNNTGYGVFGYAENTGTAGYFTSTSGYGLIVESGNVGIGTTSPTEALTVAGTIESTSGGIKFPDGTTQTSAAGTYAGMVVVAKSGGDYTNPVDAMDEHVAWCGTPSEVNPCLVKIMPGVYEIGGSRVNMVSFIDIEGSGENVTKIKGSASGQGPATRGVLSGSDNSEIRFLTVENLGGQTIAVAIRNNGVSPEIKNVTAIASGGSSSASHGVYNVSSSSIMDNVTAIASGSGGSNYGISNYSSSSITMNNVSATALGTGDFNYGIKNDSSSVTMNNVTVIASGAHYNRGVDSRNSSSIEMMNMMVTVSGGGGTNYAVRNDNSSPTLMNVTINASGGSNNNVGISNVNSSSPTLMNVKINVSGGNYAGGIFGNNSITTVNNSFIDASGAGTIESVTLINNASVKINNSVIRGNLNTDSSSNTFLGNSQFDGLVVGFLYTKCAGMTDENYTFYSNTCP